MSELAPYPIGALATRMLREFDARQSIFDLPARRFVLGHATQDWSVQLHGQTAATPFGPAAGPHTQLAQNIVLAWLAGGRVIELKTVQSNDRLKLPRPCIDMATVGYNVEWSQELTLEQSLDEYVKASMLIRILEASGRLALAPGFGRTVFDMSVGYDLAGLRDERVQAFIRGLSDATPVIERLRRELPAELGPLRDLDFASRISDTLTLSTFHGCPPDEIAAMAGYLMRTHGVHCVVKLNPTLLGATELRRTLHDELGYRELRVPDDAFTKDASWAQATDFMGRLAADAAALGRGLGVKFSNTLIVENHRDFFPASERVMYLSGPPLHVLAMQLVRRWRAAFGDRFPISFSAGIERANFADAVALGLKPVTVCTDWLVAGGYWRGAGYFEELGSRMAAVGARTIDEFVVNAYGADGPREVAAARLANTEHYVAGLSGQARYHATQHRSPPRKLDKDLKFWDCIACNKCIPVCPNDANFFVRVPPTPELPLAVGKQIVHFADFCNDCGNCEVFCLERGAPYALKPRLFVDRGRWLADAPRDAVLIESDATSGRFGGEVLQLAADATPGGDPRVQALHALRSAVLAPGEVNHVSEYLRLRAGGRPGSPDANRAEETGP